MSHKNQEYNVSKRIFIEHKFTVALSVLFSAEVLTAFSYQCRSTDDRIRMWDQCKISIGKRCQNLRKDKRQNRAD